MSVRDVLFEAIDQHRSSPRVTHEVLLVAASCCLSSGMKPEEATQAFNSILAEVYRLLEHRKTGPLSQAVDDAQ